MFTNTTSPTFIFKTMDINHPSCLPSYKLSNNPSKFKLQVCILQFIFLKMLIELCASNYAMFDGLVNGTNNIFDTPPSSLLDSKESNYVKERKKFELGAALKFQH